MVIPLVVLAIGAALAGYAGVPEGLSGGRIPNYFERLLEPSISHSGQTVGAAKVATEPIPPVAHEAVLQSGHATPAENHGLELKLTLISSIIAILGIGLGWVWFNRKPLWEPPSLLEHKYYVDEVYDAAIVQPIKQSSTSILWKIIDVHIIDGGVNGAGYLASLLGGILRRLQSGLARSYVAVLVFGALLLIGYFAIR